MKIIFFENETKGLTLQGKEEILEKSFISIDNLIVDEIVFVIKSTISKELLISLCYKYNFKNYTIILADDYFDKSITKLIKSSIKEGDLYIINNNILLPNVKVDLVVEKNTKNDSSIIMGMHKKSDKISFDSWDTKTIFLMKITENTNIKNDLVLTNYQYVSLNNNAIDSSIFIKDNQYTSLDKYLVQINDLKFKMNFDELDKFYETNIKGNQKYLLQYIFYLLETGYLNRALEYFNKYNIDEMLENDYYICEERNRLIEFSSYLSKDSEGNIQLVFEDEDVNNIYLHATNTPQTLENYMADKSRWFFYKKELDNYIGGIINMFVLRILYDRKSYNPFIITFASFGIYSLNRFSPFSRKYLLAMIIDYEENYNMHVLTIEVDNLKSVVYSLAVSLYVLDYNEYELGIKKYVHKFYKLLNVTSIKPYNFKLLPTPKKNSEVKRVALCLSGASRGDLKLQLESHRDRIIKPLEKDNVEVDIYLFTWDTKEVYRGSGLRVGEETLWYNRCFLKYENEIPKEIIETEDFKKKFPKTSKIIIDRKVVKNAEKDFKEVFPKIKVKFGNEKEFVDKYNDYDNLKSRETLNQAKMFYGVKKSINMAINSNKEYNYIIKDRLDYTFYKDITYENLEKIKDNELNVYTVSHFGMMDGTYIGKPNEVYKMSQLWDLIEETKDLSPLLQRGRKLKHHAEFLTYDWLIYNNIRPNSSFYIPLNIHTAIQNLDVPDFSKELKDDIKKFKKKDQKKYLDLFEKIQNTKN